MKTLEFRPELRPEEIRRGLALHLSPNELVDQGLVAVRLALRASATRDKHYFICVQQANTSAVFVPCSSRIEDSRVPLAIGEKRGHEHWIMPPTFVIVNQIWTVELDALLRCIGSDFSRPGRRNTVVFRAMPKIDAGLVRAFGYDPLKGAA